MEQETTPPGGDQESIEPTWAGQEIPQKSPSVVARTIAGETLLVPVRGDLALLNKLFALNEVGAYIWEQIDGRADLATIHRRLQDHFEVSGNDALQDLLEYVGLLLEAELIEKL